MKKFLHKNRLALSLGIFALVIMPGIFFGARFVNDRVESVKRVIAENELARQVHAERIMNMSTFAQQEEVIVSQRESLTVFLQNSDEAKVRLANRIDEIAREVNMVLEIDAQKEVVTAQDQKNVSDAKTTGASPTAPQVQAVPEKKDIVVPAAGNYLMLTITTTGTFDEIVRFLYKMEHMEYFNDVLAVEVKKRSARQGARRTSNAQEENVPVEKEGALEASIEVVFYLTPAS